MKALHRTALVATLVWLAGAVSAQESAPPPEPEPPLVVIPGRTDPELEPVRDGMAERLRWRLASAGVTVQDGARMRSAQPPTGRTEDLLRVAKDAGAGRALLVDLGTRDHGFYVGLRLYDVADRSLRGAVRGQSPDGGISAASDSALAKIAAWLDATPQSLPGPLTQSLGELAAIGRALRALDAGNPVSAWRSLDGHTSAAVTRLRTRVWKAAQAPNTPLAEHARLLLARGDMDTAWDAIRERLDGDDEADPLVVLAAGEIQLERGELREAHGYLARAVELVPKSADAHLGLARARALTGDPDASRLSFARAAELDPVSPRPLELAAELATDDPSERAQLLLLAGERAAAQLGRERARENFGRALRLEPVLAPQIADRIGTLEARTQNHEEALESYASAIELGGETAVRLKGVARAHRALGDAPAAEAAYAKTLELERDEPEALHELGELLTETGRPDQAAVLLERVAQIRPRNAEIKRSLARVYHARGDEGRALQLYAEADELAGPDADALAEMAAIEREHGNLAAAQAHLEAAVELDSSQTELHAELARAYVVAGDDEAAAFARYLIQGPVSQMLAPERGVREEGPPGESSSVAGLVDSFVEPAAGMSSVRLLGLREPRSGTEHVLAWLAPFTPDRARLEAALFREITSHFPQAELGSIEGSDSLVPDIDALFDFDGDDALSAPAIARVNRAFEVDAVIVARLLDAEGSSESLCGFGPQLRIEMRLLSGQLGSQVEAFGNATCLPGGIAEYGIWNRKAAGVYGLLLLLLAFPFVRGWGTVLVRFKFPPNTKPLFSVRISRRKIRTVKADDTGDETKNQWTIEDQLRTLSPFEKRLDGDSVLFQWVPARRRPYIVSVRGPMVDAFSNELVGAFQVEKTVQVRRGRRVALEFDMRLKECAIEVTLVRDRKLVPQGAVALRDVENSLRYARGKPAFLYVGLGEYTVIAAADDRVAEETVRVESLEPIKLQFELYGDEPNLVFSGCREAVQPYLEGRPLEAADALARAGLDAFAHKVRAAGQLELGHTDEAARSFEAAGQLREAAELMAEGPDEARSAELFEEAGEFSRAAEAYLTMGDTTAAARAFERAYDWERARDCYRDLGDTERLIYVLEQCGEYVEAGELAEGLQQHDRALHNYQQIERRHPHYNDMLCRIGGLLDRKGEKELAVEKFAEARERTGRHFPVADGYRLGELLQELERDEEAIEAFEAVRRIEFDYRDVQGRIEALRKRREQGTDAQAAQAEGSSRYEILEELGRGGMGVVFKARDTNLGRIVALKKLPENLKDHPTAVKLFLREARSAAALNHQNIVTVHDAGQEGDEYFITMECLEGIGLDALVKRHGKLTTRDTALLGMQASNGLNYAHTNGIIHRDIKSSNLFYTTERVVKIMDFGLAKAVEEVRRNASMIAGTPYFMAPEQALGEVVDHRADLYSLGVTLYQLVTGSVPFQSGDVTYHHRHTAPQDPRERVAEIPAGLAELLLQMLAKEPDDRVQSAAEVAERLRGVANEA